jgi:hypothetical protein
MKTALLYTFWTGDDVEMLKRSIQHNGLFVDRVIVFYQKTSNTGNFNENLFNFFSFNNLIIERKNYSVMMENGIVVSFKNFEPNLSLPTKENERIKHNLMIQTAKSQGFTHFIMAAADHFYNKNTFENAKKVISESNPDVIFTKMITYYKREKWAIWPLESYYMPFIHKMHPGTEISKSVEYPVLVDPSVKVNTIGSFHIMGPKDGILHHYSMIRTDIVKKFRNAAASVRWSKEQVEGFIEEYENAEIGNKLTYFKGAEIRNINEVLGLIKEL